MSKITNKQLIDAVVNEMPQSEQDLVKGLYGAEILKAFDQYPTIQNSFINTLTNKVTKSLVYSKVFENPLVQLKKGFLEYGDSIEQLFVHQAQMKDFTDSWESGGTAEGDLIRKLVPKVTALYVSVNMDKKSKTTVSDKQLRKAFLSETGMSNLIGGIVSSITNKLNTHEYRAMRDTLCRAIDGIDYNGNDLEINSTKLTMKGIELPNFDTKPSTLVEQIRGLAGTMQYPTDEYNMAGVETFSNKEDLVLVTTPLVNATLDVNVLAHAFNVSSTDMRVRTIEIDKFTCKGVGGVYPTTEDGILSAKTVTNSPVLEGKEVVAVLMDKDFLQIWDTFQGASTFYNGEGQYTNHFANREYIMATCLFANAIVFYK